MHEAQISYRMKIQCPRVAFLSLPREIISRPQFFDRVTTRNNVRVRSRKGLRISLRPFALHLAFCRSSSIGTSGQVRSILGDDDALNSSKGI